MQRSVLGCSLLFAAMLVWSGCSGTGTGPAVSSAPASLGGALTGNAHRVAADRTSATGVGWISPEAKKRTALLYVADQSAGAIEIYKQKGTNQQPIGAITQGVSGADGLFVDPNEKLYVCNFGNGTITVYPRAKTAPSETLTGAGSPIDVVVAGNGTVYVANFNSGTNGTVLEYPKGHTTPSKTIVTFGSGSFPEGLALDSANNLYVAYNSSDGEVLEFGPGSPSGKNLGIHVGYVGGLTIDHSNDLLLDDQNLPGVDVFPPGSTTPSEQIKGFPLAFDIALNHKNTKLWVTAPFTPAVYEVSYPAGTIVDTITSLQSAFGVATSPDGSR
jgi:hypothetical protein